MRPSEALARHRDRLSAIAAARGAGNLRVFGSTVRGEDADGSDLDLLIDLPPDISLFGVISLELEMEDALGVPVDVATEDELHPSLKARILAEARPI